MKFCSHFNSWNSFIFTWGPPWAEARELCHLQISRMALGPSHYSLSTWGLFFSQW